MRDAVDASAMPVVVHTVLRNGKRRWGDSEHGEAAIVAIGADGDDRHAYALLPQHARLLLARQESSPELEEEHGRRDKVDGCALRVGRDTVTVGDHLELHVERWVHGKHAHKHARERAKKRRACGARARRGRVDPRAVRRWRGGHAR